MKKEVIIYQYPFFILRIHKNNLYVYEKKWYSSEDSKKSLCAVINRKKKTLKMICVPYGDSMAIGKTVIEIYATWIYNPGAIISYLSIERVGE
ncbi:MAG: hypothetical protein ACRCUT_07650 [Spirochaetota bacterium]